MVFVQTGCLKVELRVNTKLAVSSLKCYFNMQIHGTKEKDAESTDRPAFDSHDRNRDQINF